MKVIPLKFYDGGFMTQAFAMGGTREERWSYKNFK